MRNINSLREMFPTSILIASTNGFSILWPSGFCGCESTERNVGEDLYPVFQELVRSSSSVVFDCVAGRSAKITFRINGFSDREFVFLPIEKDIPVEELQTILLESGVCDDWVEVFGDVNFDKHEDVARAFAEFFERVGKREERVMDFRSFAGWDDLIGSALVFHASAPFLDLESYPPSANGGSGCVVFDSSQAELKGFLHTVREDALAAFRGVVDAARDVDVLLCCCDNFTGIGFSFVA